MPEPQPERYRGERVDLVRRIPAHARRILVAGCGRGEIPFLLQRAGFPLVHAVEPRLSLSETARQISAEVFDSLDAVAGNTYDYVVLQDIAPWSGDPAACFAALRALVAEPHGQLLWLVDHEAYQGGPCGEGAMGLDAAAAVAAGFGLHVYHFWEDVDSGGALEDTPEQRLPRIRRVLYRLTLAAYDPLARARGFFDAGRPDWAYQALEEIPQGYLTDPVVTAGILHERIFYLVNWLSTQPAEQAWYNANAIHDLFYEATGDLPEPPDGYRCYAELMRKCGDTELAATVLRIYNDVYPDEGVVAQLQALAAAPAPMLPAAPPEPESDFAWPGAPRFLYLLHPRPHYGADVLYEGLCAALGDEAVDEWPYKPTLHGKEPEHLRNYPCYFDRRGEALTDDTIAERLRAGYYTAVLYADCEMELPAERTRALLQAAGTTPLVLIDPLDEFYDARPVVQAHLGVEGFHAYFKREMVRFHDYGRDTFPLPFAYAVQYGGNPPWESRTQDFFWAGHRILGMRRIVLEALESRFGWDLNQYFKTAEYNRLLNETRVGLNLFGKGFDTVRYWELPAHGCLMVSRRLPIHVPHDFTDGESAVYFDSIDELEAKLRHYFEHPGEAAQIAARGYNHWRLHHTAEARARQFLWYLHRRLAALAG